MTPNEQAFVDAWAEHQFAQQREQRARQRTYDLEKITFQKETRLNECRKAVIGHDRMLNTEEERKKLFDLIQLGDEKVKNATGS